MKKTIFIIACAGVLASCGSKKGSETKTDKDSTTTYQFFGDTITEDKSILGSNLMGLMVDKDSVEVKFTAPIKEVCQKKGCWMDVDLGGGKSMTIKFKDYGFFIPKDVSGKIAVMDGYCYKTVETVDWLKHKAKDAGKPQTSIDSITKPDTTYAFTASGVIIK